MKICDVDGRMSIRYNGCVRVCVSVCVLMYGNGYSVTLQGCVH